MIEEDIIRSIKTYCKFNRNKQYYQTKLLKLFMAHIQTNKGNEGVLLLKKMVQEKGSDKFMNELQEKGIITPGKLCTCGGKNWRIK